MLLLYCSQYVSNNQNLLEILGATFRIQTNVGQTLSGGQDQQLQHKTKMEVDMSCLLQGIIMATVRPL